MDRDAIEIVADSVSRTDDARVQLLLAYFGCASVSGLMCRILAAEPEERCVMERVVARVLGDADFAAQEPRRSGDEPAAGDRVAGDVQAPKSCTVES
jgi:hypothetical protein